MNGFGFGDERKKLRESAGLSGVARVSALFSPFLFYTVMCA